MAVHRPVSLLSNRVHWLYLLCHSGNQRSSYICFTHHCGWVSNWKTHWGLRAHIVPKVCTIFNELLPVFSRKLQTTFERLLLLQQLVSVSCSCGNQTGLAFNNSPGCFFTGDSQPMDVCSVHHNNSFLRYSVSLLGYGFYGDVLMDSERKRWLGPARYDLSGMRAIIL